MAIVLRLTNAGGTSETIVLEPGDSFVVPDGVSVELVSFDGMSGVDVAGGDLVFSSPAGEVRISGLDAEFLTTTASVQGLSGVDGPLPDGFLRLLGWSDEGSHNNSDTGVDVPGRFSTPGGDGSAGLPDLITGSNDPVSTEDSISAGEASSDAEDAGRLPATPAFTSFSNDTGVSGDSITADNRPTLRGTAEAGVTVAVFSAGNQIGNVVADVNGIWLYTLTTPLGDGPHSFTAQAIDADGRVSLVSAPAGLAVDTTAPAAPAISGFSDDTGLAGDGTTSDDVLVLSGTGEEGSTITVRDGNVVLGTAIVVNGNWAFATAVLAEGPHRFTATATDAAGNESAASAALDVTIDTTAPAAPVILNVSDDTGVDAGDLITSDNTLTLSGTAGAGETVDVLLGGVVIATVTADGAGAWTATTGALADGSHTFNARARDVAGNQGATSTDTTVTVDTSAPSAPTIAAFADDTGLAGDGVTSDATLQLSGAGEEGATITISDGATVLGAAVVAGGTWTFTTAALTEGAHSFTATATDVAGNTGAASAAFDVTVDLTAPAAPVIVGILDDTGSSNSDQITSGNTLTFTGTAGAGETINVYLGGLVVATATANGAGVWSATAAAIADGGRTYTARATDAAGNEGPASNAMTVLVDTVAPNTPAITGFSDDRGLPGDGLTSDATITLTGTADNGTRVSIFDGATLLGTVQVVGGAWSFTSAALADGAHSFTAEATDVAGNISARSAATVVTIDTSVPATPTIVSVSDDTGVSNSDRQTSDNTLTFTGSAGAGETVNVYLGGSIVATGVADGTGAWSATTGIIADGFHTFTARAVSVAGTQSGSSSNFTVVVDTAAPATPAITGFSDDRGVVGDAITSDNTLRLTGTAAGAHSVVIVDGATVLGTAFVFGGNWTFDTGVLADGSHSFTAVARDNVGNESGASVASVVTIDTARPATPSITGVSDDTGVSDSDRQTSDNTLTFTGTAGAGETVNVYLAGNIVATGIADGTGAWSATTGVVADGFQSFTARAVSVAGAQSNSSSNFTVVVDTVAPSAPTITGFSDDRGVVGDGITSDATLRLAGTAAGAHSVVIMDGATVLGTAFVFGGNWTFDTGVLTDGAHSFTAIARDNVGNESGASAATVVTIDTARPAAPMITGFSDDTGVSDSDRQTSDNTLTFTGTAGAGETVNIYLAGNIVATGIADGTGAWTATTGVIADGFQSFSARAMSIAGMLSGASNSLVIIVDTAAPAAPAITGFSDDLGTIGDGITSDTTLTLTGTAEAGTRSVTILDGSTVLGTAQVFGGTWTFNTGVLADGSHSFTVTGEDSAGNVSAASAATVVVIDTAQPAAPTITGFSDDTGFSGSDRQTSDNTLTFTGTAGAGETVNVYLRGAIVATGVADGAGAWTATTSVIADGFQTFTARAVSAAGTVGLPSSSFTVIVDTAAPAAPMITGFSNDLGAVGDGITSDNTLTLTGTAEAGTRTVTILDGSTVLGTAQVSGGTWTFNTGVLADGSRSFTVTGEDSAGNVSAASAATVVTIDTTQPAAPTITGFSDDTGFSGSDQQTSDNTLTFTGTAGAGETVNVYLAGNIVATGVADGTGAWTATTGVIADGFQSFTARAVSVAGTSSLPSSSLTVIVDTSPPAAPTISGFSDDSGTVGDGVTSDTTLTLTGTAELGTRTVTILDGSTVLGTAQVSGGTWTFTTAVLADGAHSFTVTGEDSAGNVSAASAATVVTIETAPPAAPTITGFSDDTGFSDSDNQTSDNTLTFTGTAGAGETVNVYLAGSIVATGVADGTGVWSATTGVIADGFQTFSARAASAAGAQSLPSSNLVVIVDTAAPAAPTITDFSDDRGVVGDGLTSDNTLTLTGTAEAGTRTVTVMDGSTVLGIAQVSAGTWTFNTGVLADGSHSFTVTGEDPAGNVSAGSAATVVTIDTAQPAAPTITDFSDDTGSSDSDNQTSDNTLTFTGTAGAGQTVNVYLAGNIVATGVADGTGAWTATTGVIADGFQTFNARAVSTAGVQSLPSSNFVVIVDTAAPAAPTITSFSEDLGVVGDGLTSDDRLVLTGTAEAGTRTVTVMDGSTVLGSAQVSGGAWSFNTGVLADGSHSFTVTGEDTAGNASAASAATVVTIDTTQPAAPTITDFSDDTGASDSDNQTSDNTLTFTGTAGAGETVNVYLAGNIVATGVADGSGAWTATTGVIADGFQTFSARAVSEAGMQSVSSTSFVVIVDTAAPVAPAITGYSDDRGTVGDGITSDNTLTLTGTAEAGTRTVTVMDGSTVLGTAQVSGGAWTFNTSVLADGSHSFTVLGEDPAGNVSAASAATVVTIDTTRPAAPTISDFSDDTGSSDSDNQTSDNTLTFTGTAGAGETVNIYLAGSILATGVADGTGAWTATTGVIADGFQTFSARAVSEAGMQSLPSTNFVVIVDTAAPTAPTITGYSDDRGTVGDSITSDNTLTLTGTAEAGTRTVTVMDGSTVLGTAQVSGGNWTFNTGVLADGSHSFTVTGEDTAGNTSVPSVATVVTIDTAQPAAPTITSVSDDTGFSGGDRQTSDNTLTFTGTAVAGQTVNVYLAGSVVATGIADGTGAWSATTGVIADGYQSFTARAVSVAGTQSVPSSGFVVIVDTAAPTAPTITSFSEDRGTVGDGITSDNTLTLTGTAEAGTRTVTVLDGSTVLGTAQVSGGDWTFNTGVLADGSHSFTVTGEDSAGNTSVASAPTVVTIDTSVPATPVITGFSDNTGSGSDSITFDNTVTFVGTSDPNMSVDVLSGNQVLGATMADGSGNWSFTTAPLADGIYFDIGAIARDGAGNGSARSAAFAVVVDTVLDGSAISITGISDDTGTPGDFVTSDTSLTISGVITGHTGLDLLMVELFNGGVSVGTIQADGGGNWSIDLAVPLADGDHDFTATVSDEAGNSLSTAAAQTVSVETLPAPAAPTITSFSDDTGISSSDNITSDRTLTFVGSAGAGQTINVYLAAAIVATSVADGAGNWTATTSTVSDGTHVFTARAQHTATSTPSDPSNDVTVSVDATEPDLPQLTALSNDSGTLGDFRTNIADQQILGTAEAGSRVRLYEGTQSGTGTLIGETIADGGGNWSFDYTLHTIAEFFVAVSTDVAGNVSNDSLPRTIVYDTNPPSSVNIIGFTEDTGTIGDGVTADTSITLLIDKAAGAFPRIVNVYDGTTFLGQATSGGGADYSFTTDGLSDGTYNFNVISLDDVGNENPSGNFTITVDTTGSDTYTVDDPQITSLVGGAGIDTLAFTATGSPTPVLDFTLIDDAAVTGIEQISLADPNAQTLNLTAADVLAMSDDVVNMGGTNVTRLTVFGEASDTVTTADTGWSDNGTAVDGGVTFDVFSNGTAQLYVEADIGAAVAAGAVA